MTADEIKVPAWLHRIIIGRKGAALTELTKPFPGTSVDFDEDAELVRIEGPPAEVCSITQVAQSHSPVSLSLVALFTRSLHSL
jgi:hypothetical protein